MPKVILTAEEAISLLPEGEHIHNFVSGGMMLIGCDYDREDAIKAIREAEQREIGGDACKRMNHALVVWSSETRHSFFATDPEKVAGMEAAKQEAA